MPRWSCELLWSKAQIGVRHRFSMLEDFREEDLGALGAGTNPASQIRRYLSSVQRRPDRSASWHDRHPHVRIRTPCVGNSSPGRLPRWLPVTASLSVPGRHGSLGCESAIGGSHNALGRPCGWWRCCTAAVSIWVGCLTFHNALPPRQPRNYPPPARSKKLSRLQYPGHNKQRLRRYRSVWFDEDLDRVLALLPGNGVSDLPKAKDWLAPRRPYRISGQRAACGVASMVYSWRRAAWLG